MTTLEELEKKVDAFIARSDETRADNLRRSYEEFKRKLAGGGTTPTPTPTPPTVEPTIKAKEKGISGLKAFKITGIAPTDGKKAIDGKRSTYFEGKTLAADIGGVGDIKGIAIKFKGGPYTYKLESSFDSKIWAEIPVLANTFKKNEFDVFEFSRGILARYVKISSTKTFKITTVELLGEIKGEPEFPVPEPEPGEPEPVPPVTPPSPPPVGGQDEFGIKLSAAPKPGGKVITDMSYKRSSHNTGTRDTFSKSGADFMQMQVMGYYNMSLSDNNEELSYKVFGGTHSDSAPKQGQCYSFGAEQNGGPSLKKEYPEHPTTPDFSGKAKIAPGMPSKLRSLKNRWIGLGAVIWADKTAKKVHIQVYVDDKGMVNGKPANDWKLWWTFTDDGSTMKGPAFMENQGTKNGGSALFYMRIDTVTKKTDTYGVSCREIIPPNQAVPPSGGDGEEPTEEPPAEEPVPQPTPTPGEGGWSWNLSKVRKFSGAGNKDPADSRVSLQGSGTVSIDNDTATINGSPRIHIQSDLLNCEISAEVDVNDDTLLRTRSEHARDNDPWRNGYSCGFDRAAGDVNIKKEALHPIYTKRKASEKVTYKNGFNKYANRTYDLPDGSVKIEAWLNDKKVAEAIDDGSWTDWDKVDAGELADMKKYGYTFEKMQKPIKTTDTHYIRWDNVSNAKVRSLNIRPL